MTKERKANRESREGALNAVVRLRNALARTSSSPNFLIPGPN